MGAGTGVIDVVKGMTLSPYCACGNGKDGHLFCEECWRRMPADLREQWNGMVFRTLQKSKGPIQRAPAEARDIYRRMLDALGLRIPTLKERIHKLSTRRRTCQAKGRARKQRG